MFAHPRPKKSVLLPTAKRRKAISRLEEINFDFDARADYLTGFHKRKVQRAKQAQDEAAKKAKEERLAARKQLREERRKELEAHVEAVNFLVREAKAGIGGNEESQEEVWDGIQDEQKVEPIDHEAEYIDEDRYTTVTVEAVKVSKEGLHKVVDEDETSRDNDETRLKHADTTRANKEMTAKRTWPKKIKKKKFRYESKVERKMSRAKQKTGNRLKADARRGNN